MRGDKSEVESSVESCFSPLQYAGKSSNVLDFVKPGYIYGPILFVQMNLPAYFPITQFLLNQRLNFHVVSFALPLLVCFSEETNIARD